MSEYWVSKKKYFCKYCDIYIADDAPSRRQHENGLRHQGNRDRYIRGLYKEGEKRKKDQEEEKREMARVDRLAHAAFSADVGAGIAKPSSMAASSLSTPAAATARKPEPKPSNPYANYSTAASLGYTDPDLEFLDMRKSQGVVGAWEIVETPASAAVAESSTDENQPSITPLKREAEAPLQEEDARHFKLQKRTLAAGLGQIYDPGVIPIRLKKKEEEDVDPLAAFQPNLPLPPSQATMPVADVLKATEKPQWTTLQWKRPGERSQHTLDESNDTEPPEGTNGTPSDAATTSTIASTLVKAEDGGDASGVSIKPDPEDPTSPPPPVTGPVFKKRKAPTTSVRGKREV